jgi:hypothetical protein
MGCTLADLRTVPKLRVCFHLKLHLLWIHDISIYKNSYINIYNNSYRTRTQ